MSEDNILKTTKCTQEHIEELKRNSKVYGRDHPKVAESFNALGLAYQYVSKDYRLALYSHTQALTILTRVYDKKTVGLQIGIILNDIANAYCSLQEVQNATVAFHGALEAFRSIGLSDDNPRVLSTINRMSRLNIPLPTENKQITFNVRDLLRLSKSNEEKCRSKLSPSLRRISSAPCQKGMKVMCLSKRYCKSGTNLRTSRPNYSDFERKQNNANDFDMK